VVDAAGGSAEPGSLCTQDQLSRIEQQALDALRANGIADTSESCRGRDYGIEIAEHVFAGIEPEVNLMPGVE
jgi:hypothetical protein